MMGYLELYQKIKSGTQACSAESYGYCGCGFCPYATKGEDSWENLKAGCGKRLDEDRRRFVEALKLADRFLLGEEESK